MKKNSTKLRYRRTRRKVAVTSIITIASLTLSSLAWAQKKDQKNDITFTLVPVQQFLDCLRANPLDQPSARATVVRGAQNDTLVLDLDGVKPNLTLSVFSTERSFLGADGNKDPNFKGFGLSWYQSDITTGSKKDDGHVQLQTIFLDETFGFDPDVQLPPTNTFHLGLWFDDPQDAAACGFDPTKAGPFNGEHKAGPLAFTTIPDATTGLGPLCTEPNTTTTPASCGPSSVALPD